MKNVSNEPRSEWKKSTGSAVLTYLVNKSFAFKIPKLYMTTNWIKFFKITEISSFFLLQFQGAWKTLLFARLYFFNPRFQWTLFRSSILHRKNKFGRIKHLFLGIKYSVAQKKSNWLLVVFRPLSISCLYFFRVWQSFLINHVY